jgi:MtrB/PioB family decaheme-associated outer membrane protein
VPIAPQFDLRERRDIGTVSLTATPTSHVDVTAAFTSTRHRGDLPWGASFGFGNDVEVALPYDSRTNDLAVGSEWTNGRSMLRVAYNGSWFNNLDDTLIWDSPLRLDDSATAPGRGRMALWPTNSAQTVSAAGYSKFARRTQLTGFVSYGFWNNNEALQPFTINAALPQLTLPRTNAEAEAHVFSANVGLVSRPTHSWEFTARARRYDYNNQTPFTPIPQFINYDTSLATSPTGGPEPFAHTRTSVDADATWSGLPRVALSAGYTRNDTAYDFRIFESAAENVLRLAADAIGSQSVTFHAKYEYGTRTGSGLNEDLLVEIGEQPALRHYDLANRTRNQVTGIVDFVPHDRWTFSVSGGLGDDEYPDSALGLQEATFRTLSFAADYHEPNGLGAGATYNYERYAGLQRGRSANPGQETDPLRDFTTDSLERVNYFSIYATPPRFGRNTEARIYYDFSYAEGRFLYTVVPGGPLPPPSQLPKVFNKLQQLHVDVRHRLTNHLAANVAYLYEPFRVFDFAFDQSVVNSIVQPSSLVLGYVYRPYTMHSAVVGIRYAW